MIKKIAVLAVFIFSYVYVVPLKAEAPDIAEARITAEKDVQAIVLEAKAAADHDANRAMNQLFWCVGGGTLVTISAISSALFGCWLGEVLDPPYQSSASIDSEGPMLCGIIKRFGCKTPLL